jgi:hypothetical protein
MPTILSNY